MKRYCEVLSISMASVVLQLSTSQVQCRLAITRDTGMVPGLGCQSDRLLLLLLSPLLPFLVMFPSALCYDGLPEHFQSYDGSSRNDDTFRLNTRLSKPLLGPETCFTGPLNPPSRAQGISRGYYHHSQEQV
ncbi:hypothetical protein GGI43DRAFT_44238 [Trichoderma evansii]